MKCDINLQFGKDLEKYRINNGITKTKFCSWLKVSRPTYDKVIKGIASDDTYYKIAIMAGRHIYLFRLI